MPDLRHDPAFAVAVESTRQAIFALATDHNIPDAEALVRRARGENQLSGHAHSVLPLAVLVARTFPHVLTIIRARTDLHNSMAPRASETRDTLIWTPVKRGVQLVVATRGDDIIAEEIRTGNSQTVDRVATTYLSLRYGGGQPQGGAGDTVLKRTLKLMAHLSIEL